MTACSFSTASGTCANSASSQLRLIPRRTDQPIADEIRRALAWPDTELATTVFTCAFHRDVIRKAAQVVMVETPLGDAVVMRKVMD